MIRWVVKLNRSEPGLPLSMVLNGVPETTERTESVTADVYFQFADDPEMKPQFLVTGVAGKTAVVPFDFKGRDIILTMVSKTKDGKQNVSDLAQGEKLLFPATAVAQIATAIYDDGPNEVTVAIFGNRGTGTIRILRRIGSEEYSEIANVPFDATDYVDEPPIDGTYSYKLTQDGQTGESATKTVIVDSAGSSVGSPPSGLNAVYDDVETVSLTWSNNGGTGSNVIERRVNLGAWADLVTLSSGTTSYNDTPVLKGPNYRTHYYRVKNLSAPGYSNEADAFIERY